LREAAHADLAFSLYDGAHDKDVVDRWYASIERGVMALTARP
jgi:hypothetical protein